MKENKEIKKANKEYEYLTGDEAERRLAFLRDKAIRDEISFRETGKEQGRREEKITIARELLKLGMSIEEIQKVTKLEKEVIEKLK